MPAMVKSAIFALPLWMGNLQTVAVEGLSQSHQPSFASREGMVILRGRHRFAGRTMRSGCAIAWKVVCKSSGFLCSFCAAALMRSRPGNKFDTGDVSPAHSHAANLLHADHQTYRRHPDLVCRTAVRVRRGEQERSLSDCVARRREHRPVHGEHCRPGRPDPPRCGAGEGSQGSCWCCCGACRRCRWWRRTHFELRKQDCPANGGAAGAQPWAAFHRRLLVVCRSGAAGRERSDRRHLHHQTQYRAADGGDAESRNLGLQDDAARRRSCRR